MSQTFRANKKEIEDFERDLRSGKFDHKSDGLVTEEMRTKHREQYGLGGAYDTDEQIIDLQNIKPSGIVLKSKYDREIKKDVYVDVYDVLCCFCVTNPAIAHAVKKLLMPGGRGHKGMEQDLHEAIQSIYRGIEIEEERLRLTHII